MKRLTLAVFQAVFIGIAFLGIFQFLGIRPPRELLALGGPGQGADGELPVVSITSPSGRVSGTVIVSANATDNVSVSRIEVFIDNNLWGQANGSSFSQSWNTNTGEYTDGSSHTIRADAYDPSENKGSVSVTVMVDNRPPPDTAPPSVQITAPANGATVSGTVTISATATDDTGIDFVEFFVNGSLLGRGTTVDGISYNRTWDTKNGGYANGLYTLTAKAYDRVGKNRESAPVSVTVENETPPAAPANLRATVLSSSAIQLDWESRSSNETNFRLERSSTGGTSGFQEVAVTGRGAETFTDTGLGAGTTYWYRVRASNSAGYSDYSNVISATTNAASGGDGDDYGDYGDGDTPSPPNTPSGLSGTALSDKKIKLTWNDTSADEDVFEIQQSSDNAYFTSAGETTANVTTITVSGLAADTLYYFRVRAFNDGGYSSFSSVISVETLAGGSGVSSLAAPTALSATAVSPRSVKLKWQDNSSDETAFQIQQSLDGSAFSAPAETSANFTEFVINGLTPDTFYYFRVRALRGSDISSFSNAASVRTPAEAVSGGGAGERETGGSEPAGGTGVSETAPPSQQNFAGESEGKVFPTETSKNLSSRLPTRFLITGIFVIIGALIAILMWFVF